MPFLIYYLGLIIFDPQIHIVIVYSSESIQKWSGSVAHRWVQSSWNKVIKRFVLNIHECAPYGFDFNHL